MCVFHINLIRFKTCSNSNKIVIVVVTGRLSNG